MKHYFFFIVMLVFAYQVNAQSGTSKLSRAERKAFKEERLEAREGEVAKLLNDTIFIIQANRFSSDGAIFGSQWAFFDEKSKSLHGGSPVNPQYYFVMVNKDQIILQTGLSNERELTRVPEITLKGTIRDWEVITSRNGKSKRVKADFSTSFGHYSLDVRITNSGLSSASIEALSTGGSMQFHGNLRNPETADYYIGGQIY